MLRLARLHDFRQKRRSVANKTLAASLRCINEGTRIDAEQSSDLQRISGLPQRQATSDTASNVFDHLARRMQLAMLRAQPAFTWMAEKVVARASARYQLNNSDGADPR